MKFFLTLVLVLLSGRLFDKDGNVNNWWSLLSMYGFTVRANCLSKQYSQFEVYGQKVKWHAVFLFFIFYYASMIDRNLQLGMCLVDIETLSSCTVLDLSTCFRLDKVM